jgi:hypothetical protein
MYPTYPATVHVPTQSKATCCSIAKGRITRHNTILTPIKPPAHSNRHQKLPRLISNRRHRPSTHPSRSASAPSNPRAQPSLRGPHKSSGSRGHGRTFLHVLAGRALAEDLREPPLQRLLLRLRRLPAVVGGLGIHGGDRWSVRSRDRAAGAPHRGRSGSGTGRRSLRENEALAPRWDTAAARRGGGRDDEAEVGVGCDERERERVRCGGEVEVSSVCLCVCTALSLVVPVFVRVGSFLFFIFLAA